MNQKERAEAISRYAKAVSQANKETAKKELFVILLRELFGGKDTHGVIEKFAAGAETRITNIEREGKASPNGQADTQYGSVIIEFENDLKKTGEHAKDQLADYLSGNWNSGMRTRFTLIATDCLTWMVYAPDYNSLIGLGRLKADKIRLEKVAEFKIRPGKSDDFYFFLDRYLFGTEPVPATLEEIRKRFGQGSDIFRSVIYHMHKAYETVRNTPEMKVARLHWERFLRIAYGKFEAADYIFLIHSYLSVLAKMIAYEVISGDEWIDDQEIAEIVSGEVFRRKNVSNFTDNDFYRWTGRNIPELKEAYRTIAAGLSEMDFSEVNEDILKGVYQELVDDDTKHGLGECYTPDWLCGWIIGTMKPKPGQKLLDPSCGSGSFLKAAANFLIAEKPDITASELNDCLYGIDVHPLSVQITKATLLIAYGKRLAAEKDAIRLNVYLANSLLLPTSEADLFGDVYRVNVDSHRIDIPRAVFGDYKSLSKLVETAESLAERAFQDGKEKKDAAIRKIFAACGFAGDQAERSALSLYKALLSAKQSQRNGIWGYILANTYAPIALKEQFDLVVGNPPWLTYSDITAKDYQDEVKEIARRTGALPESMKLFAHIELAVIFAGHSVEYFLKPDGKLALVMPRSLFSADHHQNIRDGKIQKLELDSLWDLDEVRPLFKVPACVILGERSVAQKKTPIPGFSLSGKLPGTNSPLSVARKRLAESAQDFYLCHLNGLTAWGTEPILIKGRVPYKDRFAQGATLVPRRLCFVDIDQDISGDLKDRVVRVKSSDAVLREAKGPWKKVSISGSVHTDFLFRTILANNIVPFGVTGAYRVALPLMDGKMATPDEIENAGFLKSAEFFRDAVKEYDANVTERGKAKNFGYNDRLNFQNGITGQSGRGRYAVIYNRSGTNAVSAVIDLEDSGLPNIFDNAEYFMKTNIEDEAFYVCAFLNSRIASEIIKPFQSRGLQGERDIHKKILEVPLPEFDRKHPAHRKLADLAREAAEKAAEFIDGQGFDEQGNNLTPIETGKLRTTIRGVVSNELDEIDPLVRKLIGM